MHTESNGTDKTLVARFLDASRIYLKPRMLGMLSFWQLVLKGAILVIAILLNEKLRKGV